MATRIFTAFSFLYRIQKISEGDSGFQILNEHQYKSIKYEDKADAEYFYHSLTQPRTFIIDATPVLVFEEQCYLQKHHETCEHIHQMLSVCLHFYHQCQSMRLEKINYSLYDNISFG